MGAVHLGRDRLIDFLLKNFCFKSFRASLYFATEFIEGVTLDQTLLTNEIMDAIFEGLATVHVHGILHSDIHAKSILVAKTRVKMIDFGFSQDSICFVEQQLELENVYAMLLDESVCSGVGS